MGLWDPDISYVIGYNFLDQLFGYADDIHITGRSLTTVKDASIELQ